MPTPGPISNRPTEPALDLRALYTQGIEHAQRLSRRVWTDFNIHDPGVTTLELLCYAITDLAYRGSLSVPDLLASGPATTHALFSPRESLTTEPVTRLDHRRLLIDVPGIRNAWWSSATHRLWADTLAGRLWCEPQEGPGVYPVDVSGLYDMRVQFDPGLSPTEQATALATCRARLEAHRQLCTCLRDISEVTPAPFLLCAELDIAPNADPVEVRARILFHVQRHLSPDVPRYTLSQRLSHTHADGTPLRIDEIFSTPILDHGFVDDDELAASELRTELRLSDIIHVIMDVPGVVAIRDITMNPPGATATPADRWRIPVPPGQVPQLDPTASRLVLYKQDLPTPSNAGAVQARLAALEAAAIAAAAVDPADLDLAPPPGRRRETLRYSSFQTDFPEVYGIGPTGLASNATAKRRAQASQLRSYLLFFDQLMADYLAHLHNLTTLLSTDPEQTRTLFHQVVDSFPEHTDAYAVGASIPTAAAIQPTLESLDLTTSQLDRRNRFLDHLIARFAEQFSDYASSAYAAFGEDPLGLIRSKGLFLQDYPRLSRERPRSWDRTTLAITGTWDTTAVSGLERRLCALLGIPRAERRRLSEVTYAPHATVAEPSPGVFQFQVIDPTHGAVLLQATAPLPTEDDARLAMVEAIRLAQDPSRYLRQQAGDGTWTYRVLRPDGAAIATRSDPFPTRDAVDRAIHRVVTVARERFGEEGMFVVEHLLLLPSDEPDGGDLSCSEALMPICATPGCADCADHDPYSARVHVILPAWAGRFLDPAFRAFAERLIRDETPAHLLPKICWVSLEDMADFERVWRGWLEVRAGTNEAPPNQTLAELIDVLFRLKSVYPTSTLSDCASELPTRFVLGRTTLGTLPTREPSDILNPPSNTPNVPPVGDEPDPVDQ